MLLGRSSPDSPPMDYTENDEFCQRVVYVAEVEKIWWKHWIKEVLPTILPARKWKSKSTNLRMGDIVMLTYKGNFKDDYILAKVIETFPDKTGLVRKVRIKYRKKNIKEDATKCKSTMLEEIIAVQRLVLIEPVSDE